jgi:hypothetical protein
VRFKVFARENILIVIPFLFYIYIYFIKNDNPRWVITFQGISESLESAFGFFVIWWLIFLMPYFLHLKLRWKKTAGVMRWLHIILSVIFVAIFYWLFFEKTGITPGWHTTITPFEFRFANSKISVFSFTLIACVCVLSFYLYFMQLLGLVLKNKKTLFRVCYREYFFEHECSD